MGKRIGNLIIDIFAWIFWAAVVVCVILLIGAARHGLVALLH